MSAFLRVSGVVVVAIAVAFAGLWHGPAPAFRWLPGFAAHAVTTDRSNDAIERLAAIAESCAVSDAQEVTADVAPAAGDELVLASMPTGVVVLDADGRRIAWASLGPCGGSADGIVALAVGDAWIGAPVIAVVSSSGGHRESETTLTLFRADPGGLTRIFDEPIELRDGLDLWTGTAALVPGAIIFHAPTGELSVHVLRPAGTDAATPRHDAV